MSVDPETGAWLRSDGLRKVEANAAAAAWGALAVESEVRSPFDAAAQAAAEGQRQSAFLAPPRVTDRLRVPGRHAGLIGKAVTISAPTGGYAAGVVVFVVGVRELSGDDASELTVIRRMA